MVAPIGFFTFGAGDEEEELMEEMEEGTCIALRVYLKGKIKEERSAL